VQSPMPVGCGESAMARCWREDAVGAFWFVRGRLVVNAKHRMTLSCSKGTIALPRTMQCAMRVTIQLSSRNEAVTWFVGLSARDSDALIVSTLACAPLLAVCNFSEQGEASYGSRVLNSSEFVLAGGLWVDVGAGTTMTGDTLSSAGRDSLLCHAARNFCRNCSSSTARWISTRRTVPAVFLTKWSLGSAPSRGTFQGDSEMPACD
jgi:hypothetical protein